MTSTVLVEVRGNVQIMTLSNPEARNAATLEMAEAMVAALDALDSNPALQVGIVTGAGGTFCAGMDLKGFLQGKRPSIAGRGFCGLTQKPPRKPLIAAVEGHALGGGCELAMHCDLIVAGASARFAQPEIRVGVMPGAGGTQRLVRAVGKFQALRMLFTGCTVRAPEALAIGLVSEVAADGQALDRALELARQIAGLPPLALAQIKEVVLAGADLPLDQALALERKAFQLLFDSHDQKEGMRAFLEKRTAEYLGK